MHATSEYVRVNWDALWAGTGWADHGISRAGLQGHTGWPLLTRHAIGDDTIGSRGGSPPPLGPLAWSRDPSGEQPRTRTGGRAGVTQSCHCVLSRASVSNGPEVSIRATESHVNVRREADW